MFVLFIAAQALPCWKQSQLYSLVKTDNLSEDLCHHARHALVTSHSPLALGYNTTAKAARLERIAPLNVVRSLPTLLVGQKPLPARHLEISLEQTHHANGSFVKICSFLSCTPTTAVKSVPVTLVE